MTLQPSGFLLDKVHQILRSQRAPIGLGRTEAKPPEPSCVGQVFLAGGRGFTAHLLQVPLITG